MIFSVALGLLLFWAPLPFGSVGSGFKLLLWGLVSLVFVGGLWTKDVRKSWLPARAVVFCLFAVVGLAFLQSLSWPPSVARVLSPNHYELAQTADFSSASGPSDSAGGPVSETGEEVADRQPARVPMSFSSQSSQRAAMAWAVMALAVLTASLLGTRRERRVVLGALVCAAVFQTIYGGPRAFGGADLIWGQVVPAAQGRFRGTFVNPNHAAFFVGLALPLVTAWVWLNGVRFKDREYGRLGVLFVGLPLAVWVLLAGGLLLTQSRAGALVMVVVLGTQLMLLFKKGSRDGSRRAEGPRARGLRVGVILAAIALPFVLWLVLRSTSGGLEQRLWESRIAGSAGGARSTVYHSVMSLWREFPLFGSGLGSFRELFSARGPRELPGQWWNAHSDWLELLVTGGALSVVLVLVALVLVLRRTFRSTSSISRERRATAVAVIGSLAVAVLHSFVDFGVAMPANALAVAVLAGIGLAPSTSEMGARRPGSGPVDVDDG